MIIGCCGHDITKERIEDCELTIKEIDPYYGNVSSFGVYCKKCRKMFEKAGLVLHNQQEIDDWVNSKK